MISLQTLTKKKQKLSGYIKIHDHSTGFKGPGTLNFDITPRSFTVILLITFDFQHFLT